MSSYLGFEPTKSSEYFFVSYNSNDAHRVGPIAKAVSDMGVDLWYDHGIEYGENWETFITEKIHNAQAVVLFFTKGILSKKNSYVQREYKIATQFFHKKVYMVLLDDIENEEVPVDKISWWLEIREIHSINGFAYPDSYSLAQGVVAMLGHQVQRAFPTTHTAPIQSAPPSHAYQYQESAAPAQTPPPPPPESPAPKKRKKGKAGKVAFVALLLAVCLILTSVCWAAYTENQVAEQLFVQLFGEEAFHSINQFADRLASVLLTPSTPLEQETEPSQTQPDDFVETTEPDETIAPSETTEPETTEPETTEPETTEPETTEPETTEPEITEPDTTEPDTTEPDTTEPDTTEPETTEPEPDNPPEYSVGLQYQSHGDGTCSVVGIGSFTGINLNIPKVSPDGDVVTVITDYAFFSCDNLVSVTIPDSVKEIRYGVFAHCSQLTKISVSNDNSVYHSQNNCIVETATNTLKAGCKTSIIPDYVTTIGAYAFQGCSIQTVIIPNSVKTIEHDAFRESGLKTVTVPASVVVIESMAFYDCTQMDTAIIPSSVTSIGSGVFSGCRNLTAITVEQGNSVYHSKDNCLIETTSNTLIAGCQASIIPDYTVVIDEYAFHGHINLTSITIPNGVQRIEGYAFLYCGLTSIFIPESISYIDPTAFYDCACITSIVVSDRNEHYVSIDNCLIERKSNMVIRGGENSIIPNGVLSIGYGAFASCYGIKSFVLPNSVTCIGEYAFAYCYNLNSVVIPNSVTHIEKYAFYNCEALTHIYFTGTEQEWNAIRIEGRNDSLLNATIHYNYAPGVGDNPDDEPADYVGLQYQSHGDGTCSVMGIGSCTDTEIVIPEKSPAGDTVVEIGREAFRNCEMITAISIPNSVTNIDDYAFFGCKNLTNFVIPNGVKYIGDFAFSDMSCLQSIVIPASVQSIGYEAFYNCQGLTSVIMENGVQKIGKFAFQNCPNLKTLVIPQSLIEIAEPGAFAAGALTSIEVAEGNPVYYSVNNCLIERQSKKLILGCQNSIIPDDITSIGNYAFMECENLTGVVIPNGVTSIGICAFAYSTSLTSVVIPYGVTEIGESAFFGCANIESIVLPDSVTSIGSSVFADCTNLSSIVLPNGITILPSGMFSNCWNLKDLIVPNSVTCIEQSFIWGHLENVYFMGSEAEWNAIDIRSDNDRLLAATVHFNYIPNEGES